MDYAERSVIIWKFNETVIVMFCAWIKTFGRMAVHNSGKTVYNKVRNR